MAAFLSSGVMMGVWFCTLAYLGFVIWYRRKKRAELNYLLALDETLGTGRFLTPHARIR
jgi:hypothetical protein